jgi:phosphatidylinositol-4,5-bisphosphate 3-kinase
MHRKTSWRDRIIYQYPPRLVMNKINNQATKKIKVDLKWDDFTETEVDNDTTAESLVKELGRKYGFEDDHVDQCCIKTIGEASYLLGGHMLKDYAFIKENSVPRLVVVSLDTIEIEMASDNIYISLERDVLAMGNGFSSSPCTPQSPSAPASPRSLPRKTSLTSMSLYNLAASSPFQYSTTLSTSIEDKFKIKIETINISMDVPNSGAKFCLQVGLFHGGRQICPLETIVMFKGRPSVVEGDHQGILEVDREVEFDILVSCLPRMTKLCFGFFEKRKTTQHPLSWVNTNVFDYMSKMRKSDTLHMWKYFLGTVMPTCEMLSPLRCNVSNVNSRESITSIVLTIQDDLDHQKKVQFPNSVGKTTPMMPINEHSNNGFNNNTRITKLYGEELVSIANYDPLHQVTVQEKELIWNVRTYCMNLLPQLLPRIIDCVDYSNMNHVAELHYLLERWPLLSPEDALQLLDYAYPDEAVRSFAVKSLRVASDDTITCYLLQLAQALKHESYLQCDLVEFLLERALNNQHIGHHLFWELKAEMNSPTAGLLYGLILEAYLAAAPEHLKLLEHQMTLLDKCRETHLNLQKMEVTTRSYEKAKNRFAASMRSQFYGHHPYRNFVNPLNPSQKCKRLIIDKCRLMNSKMRPQMLFFDNVDTNHLASNDLDDIVLMFKKGDDLRQDRLTLQLLTVMDRIWKEDGGLDLRLNVYRAVSTDLNEGFIQVVMNAETVCKIQMKQVPDNKLKLTAALNKGLILSWLKSHNPSPEQMKRAQWEFTQSCAGYSVATYILGIADRHNDNIMVRTNGQLFHIDFGHFLGNYKYKFGIKRERVPMVLPAEFVEVIRVADFGNVNNFETFRQLCEQAFVTIRRRAGLIISLLKMMISTGLPELNSDQDLNIVRTTLHLDQVSEQEALELFRKDFNESLRNAWTISINWWVHMMNQMRSKGVK